MAPVESDTERQVRDLVYDFFADECEVDRHSITDQTNIIEELEGDSLMLLALLESVCKTFGLTIELKALGRHLMKKPANTIGDIIVLTNAIVKHGNGILNVDI
ncbi:MAG TPA: phosphopantetheine-binding protein [Candidatus Hydrogenedentes bacterium]|nr:phosphopantetheine-binding protein [Candidatus Hydrogenedentota bacterium]HOS01629.1 phosphopantetheine-binding protein [Candidatus Hydrogenedentota bacterium]